MGNESSATATGSRRSAAPRVTVSGMRLASAASLMGSSSNANANANATSVPNSPAPGHGPATASSSRSLSAKSLAAKIVSSASAARDKRKQWSDGAAGDGADEPVTQEPTEYFSPTKKVRKNLANGSGSGTPPPAPAQPQEPTSTTANKASTQQPEIPRDRVVSCPDHLHHSESELLARLDRILETEILSSEDVSQPVADARFAVFEGKSGKAPKISVASYLQRLTYYLGAIAEFERSTGGDVAVHSDMAFRYLLSTVVLLERLHARTGLVVTKLNVHRLIITGTMICAKTLDDIQPDANYWADLGGVTTAELSQLEWTFLELLGYQVIVSPEEFQRKYDAVLAGVPVA